MACGPSIGLTGFVIKSSMHTMYELVRTKGMTVISMSNEVKNNERQEMSFNGMIIFYIHCSFLCTYILARGVLGGEYLY